MTENVAGFLISDLLQIAIFAKYVSILTVRESARKTYSQTLGCLACCSDLMLAPSTITGTMFFLSRAKYRGATGSITCNHKSGSVNYPRTSVSLPWHTTAGVAIMIPSCWRPRSCPTPWWRQIVSRPALWWTAWAPPQSYRDAARLAPWGNEGHPYNGKRPSRLLL